MKDKRSISLSVTKGLLEKGKESLISVLPIILIVLLLHITIVPLKWGQLLSFLIGTILLVAGTSLFTLGAEVSMMPMGERIGSETTKSRKLPFILITCFIIGAVVTIAEPDLKVLAHQVPIVADNIMMFSVAIGVGLFLMISFLRVYLQIPLSWLLIGFYLIIFALMLSPLVPDNFIAVAFDSGGVTTGPITVPFIMALGLGLASVRGDKTTEEDSFGLVALCSIGPICTVMLLGIFNGTGSASQSVLQIAEDAGLSQIVRVFWEAFPLYAGEVLIALLPILAVFLLYQLFFLHIGRNQVYRILIGLIYTWGGLVLFLTGVNVGFMPVGYQIGTVIAGGHQPWLLVPLGLLLGFFIVTAEPAVQLLKNQVEDVTDGAITGKALGLSLAIAVAASVGLSMIRILTGMSIWYLLLPGYLLSLGISFFVTPIFTAISFDSGGVASGPMTATFLLPLALGACEAMGGNPLTDAFGIVALVAMTPLITIQILGLISRFRTGASKPSQLLVLEDGGIVEYELMKQEVTQE